MDFPLCRMPGGFFVKLCFAQTGEIAILLPKKKQPSLLSSYLVCFDEKGGKSSLGTSFRSFLQDNHPHYYSTIIIHPSPFVSADRKEDFLVPASQNSSFCSSRWSLSFPLFFSGMVEQVWICKATRERPNQLSLIQFSKMRLLLVHLFRLGRCHSRIWRMTGDYEMPLIWNAVSGWNFG